MDADLFIDDARPARGAWAQRLWAAMRGWRLPSWAGSLYLRLVLGGLVALLAAVGVTLAMMTRQAEAGLLDTAHASALDETRREAAALGQGLDRLIERIAFAAARLPAEAFSEPERAAGELARELLPGSVLSNVYVGRPGQAGWGYADAAGVRRFEVTPADRELVDEAVRLRRPTLSQPLLGRVSGEPVVVMLHPVLHEGRVVGVVGGSLRLASRDLLAGLMGQPAEPAKGQGGDGQRQAFTLTDREGRILAHRERSRLMARLAEDDSQRGAWQAWQAREASGQAATATSWSASGLLYTAAPVPGHDWLLWSALPLEAVLAPVAKAQRAVVVQGVMLALGLTLLLALLLRWQLQPLRRLERHARALLAGEDRGDWPQADGEIGRLARTLHHLWAERTQMESFNAQVLQKLGSVMAASPVGLAFTRNQNFELVSDEICRMLGRQQDEVLGQPTQIIFASNEDYAALGPQVGAAFASGHPYSGEWPLLRADGSRFWGLLRARPVAPDDPCAGTIWSLNDVSEQVAARRQLEHAAHHDALTGVVNRQGFEGALQTLFDAQPGSRPASLVMIDLDHFKPINDTAGHAAGDAMLVAVAQAIGSRVRATDIVVRLGGDEFALLLPHCPHERALGVAEKVREAITDLALTWEAHTLRVGASLGVAELSEHHESAAQWMAQADAACYEAKRHGRGRVRLARPELRVMQGGR